MGQLSTGEIAGIVAGAIAIVMVLLTLLMGVLKHRKGKRTITEISDSNEDLLATKKGGPGSGPPGGKPGEVVELQLNGKKFEEDGVRKTILFDKRMSGIDQLKDGQHPGGEAIEEPMTEDGKRRTQLYDNRMSGAESFKEMPELPDDGKRRTQLYDNRMSGAESFKEMPADHPEGAPVADIKREDLRWSKNVRRKTGLESPPIEKN